MTVSCRYCQYVRFKRLVEVVVETCSHPAHNPTRQIRVRSRVSISAPPIAPIPDWCPLRTNTKQEESE